jgi:RimJ/RimL family protein N-acetyltransferase
MNTVTGIGAAERSAAQPTLTTARLILRPFALEDAPAVQQLAGAREVADTTLNIPHPYRDGVAEAWILTHRQLYRVGVLANFAVVLRGSEELLGAVGLRIEAMHGRAELGYWIGVPHWGKGFCTEAARAVLDYGFNVLGLVRVHASHLKRNPASGRVMQKLGMRREEGCATTCARTRCWRTWRSTPFCDTNSPE